MKTFSPRPRDIERRWYVVDANGAVLGRLASHVASILRGKHKPIYAPHADTGDHVIVVNAKGVRLTGGKEFSKVQYRHSGYPGGLRRIGYDRLLAERPAVAVEKAIGGMLPKNRLGRQMLGKLSVYDGAEHPHQAQQPLPLSLGEFPRWEGLPKPKPKPAPSVQEGTRPAGRKVAEAAEPAKGRRAAAGRRRTGAAPAAKARSGARAVAKASTAVRGRRARTTGAGSAGPRRGTASAPGEAGSTEAAPTGSRAAKAASPSPKANAGGEKKKTRTRRASRRTDKES